MLRFPRLLAVAALAFAVTAPALAVAQPVPVFTVPGVVNNGALGTFFACTNGDTVIVTVSVEVFGQNGASINSTAAVGLAPQATILFGTNGAVGLAVDANVSVGLVDKGSAHILATSKKIACSAFLADVGNNPPTSMTTLTVAAKGKQKGD